MGFKSVLFAGLMGLAVSVSAMAAEKRYAVSMHGDIKYGPDFTHFDYTNPDAPKGGTLRLSALGSTFDTFHGFTLKGIPAIGSSFPFETLTTQSLDEPFSAYGLLAETIQMPEDRSWVAFDLRKEARWHDGKPVTADDVVFSFNTLMEKGHPRYRFYYADVTGVEKTGERSVKFTFKDDKNRELAMIVGQLPILPKHYWADKDFTKTTLVPPLGSGPYKIKSFESGRNVVYERVKDYWGADLAVNAGQNNFDEIRFDYYRDATVAVEAFKGGAFDYRYENVAKNWATAYDIPEVKNGLIKRLRINHEVGTGMQGFVFNIRRDKFKDPLVRQALAYAFDFDWANKNLFHNEYTRTNSYFSNSELGSSGLPTGRELEILEKYRGKVPESVFTTEYIPPKTDGSGKIRKNLKEAVGLLKKAGYVVKNRKLVNLKTGKPLTFEILLQASPAWERIVLPFKKNLERLGVDVSVRMVDTAQYKERSDTFDYDVIVDVFGQSQSPGNEQYDYWTSASADRNGSRNSIGVKDPVIDELVEMVVNAPTREELVMRTRALDRVLLAGHYVIPNWHLKVARIVAWDKFGMPEKWAKYNPGYSAWAFWWFDEEKAKALEKKRKK
ncbi:extracellular solute-binding protein [Terasakiella sp. A23]|uniref:extracellular solute-binding protein n=1 Tax=Terasakiella sp. FCG-A23 TaxID=3080561 RepID=UPI0029542A46|nr:extracellular solute-binding protein [Terasakiella sp. A23]MDV7339714.1 extracellular solute-binding protein [Terasakiella sp. A23]